MKSMKVLSLLFQEIYKDVYMIGTIFLFIWLFVIFATLVQTIRGKMLWSEALPIIIGMSLFLILLLLVYLNGGQVDFANREWPY